MNKIMYRPPFVWILNFSKRFYAHFQKPFMVYGYYNKVQNIKYKNVRISSNATILDKTKFDVSDHVWIWHNSIVDATNGVKIGEGTQIGANVGIFSHSSELSIRLLGRNYINIPKENRIGYVRKSVEIGEYTFIASGTYVLAGVKIGKGCVIGANAIVSKDIPDFSVAVGAPAKVIGSVLKNDEKYFDNTIVQENYFDKSIIENYLNSKRNEK